MANSMKLGEVAVAGIKAKLQAGMPARIATINAEKADSLPMLAPANDSYFEGRMEILANVPAIFILEGKGRFTDEGSHSLIFTTTIRVCIVEGAENGPRLAIRLQRQARAVIEVLYDDQPLEATTSSFQVSPLSILPGRVFEQTDEKDGWRSSYDVHFLVKQVEL